MFVKNKPTKGNHLNFCLPLDQIIINSQFRTTILLYQYHHPKQKCKDEHLNNELKTSHFIYLPFCVLRSVSKAVGKVDRKQVQSSFPVETGWLWGLLLTTCGPLGVGMDIPDTLWVCNVTRDTQYYYGSIIHIEDKLILSLYS